jgi:amidophosphoribosyltransferase
MVSVLESIGAEKREYCGALGIYSFAGKDIAHDIYLGLMNLQHRGQDSAGAAVFGKKGLLAKRGLGYVPDVLNQEAIDSLPGHVGVGHVRYPTIGAGGAEDAQPFLAEAAGVKIALAHNGNVSNYGRVRKAMEDGGAIFCSTCDAELILASYARHFEKTTDHFEAAAGMMGSMDGAYSVVLATDRGELVAFRDPQAIRPLCFGQDSEKIVFASESVALDIIGCPLAGDLAPGEVIVVSQQGVERKVVSGGKKPRHCMFEYVYFSRPDSRLDGKWVYEVRHRLGRQLAKAAPVKADVVVAVPDTARSAVEGYSEQSGIPVAEGLIKNRYIGRTFIMPSQKKRQEAVRLKLNAVRHVVEGKRVVLIDDSIVRGTTMGPIVKLVRAAGAKEVHLRITCPPVLSPCFYGIDIPSFKELVAANKSVEEICKSVGADSLVYQSMDGLVASIGMKREELCTGCISGEYPTEFGGMLARKMKEAKSAGAIRAWEEKE